MMLFNGLIIFIFVLNVISAMHSALNGQYILLTLSIVIAIGAAVCYINIRKELDYE